MLRIFDIQRFALHDGPGIRTTVFVKGCPLNCLWCHNPESKSGRPQLACQFSACIACGECVGRCPNGAHEIREGLHQINFTRCKGCGQCVSACPTGALKLYGTEKSTAELMETVLSDAPYYARSGGGLTVSGGEPMAQAEGVLELLSEAKRKGVHTCLDTSGYAPREQFERLLPVTDVFLYDYKATDPLKHKRLTDVSNELILSNLDFLCSRGATVQLRCPMIPGLNVDDAHLEAIAQLSRTYARQITAVNVMAYHNMAAGKVAQIGQDYGLKQLPTMTKEEKQAICEKLLAFGCLNLKDS